MFSIGDIVKPVDYYFNPAIDKDKEYKIKDIKVDFQNGYADVMLVVDGNFGECLVGEKYFTLVTHGFPEPRDFDLSYPSIPEPPKCECGAWSVNSKIHSGWCQIRNGN